MRKTQAFQRIAVLSLWKSETATIRPFSVKNTLSSLLLGGAVELWASAACPRACGQPRSGCPSGAANPSAQRKNVSIRYNIERNVKPGPWGAAPLPRATRQKERGSFHYSFASFSLRAVFRFRGVAPATSLSGSQCAARSRSTSIWILDSGTAGSLNLFR